MKRTLMTILAALALVAAAPAVAQEPTPAPSPTAPTITLTAEQFAALVAKTSAGPAAAPAVVQPAAPTSSVNELGLFGFSWSQVGALLLTLFGVVGALWKGAVWVRIQKAVPDAIDAAYWFVERNFGDLEGPQKALVAMGSLYQGLTGHGLLLDSKVAAQANTRWKLLAAANPSTPAPVAPPAKDLAAATAAADVSKQVAGGATAADLLKQAGS